MTALELAWEAYGGALLGDHGRVKAQCPLHDDSHASARVDLDAQRWTCYAGCGHGDIYELIKLVYEQRSEILTFPEQKRIAAEKFGAGQRPGAVATKRKKTPWKPPWLRK